jgi:cytochrome c551/c552
MNMKRKGQRMLAAVWLAAVVVAGSRLGAEIVTITLPPDTAAFKVAPGSSVVSGQCLTCHSALYVSTQPPLSYKTWLGEVTKMQQKYGAPIATNELPQIAYYLAVNYGTGAPAEAPASAETNSTVVPMTVVRMATIYGCLACHQPDKKVVGPAYKDVRAKYLNDPQAIEKIMAQIHHGGTGKWGTGVMPPFTMVSDADAKRLAEWIMSGDGTK